MSWIDSYGDGLFGLLGVLVGGVITYFANKRLSNHETMGRIAIQRKNLIYAKMYKKLLDFHVHLDERVDNFYLMVFTKESHRNLEDWDTDYYYLNYPHNKYEHADRFVDFDLWQKMKTDIRRNYVPQRFRSLLDKLNEKILEYINQREQVIEDFQKIFRDYYPFFNKQIFTSEGASRRILLNDYDFVRNLFSSGVSLAQFFRELHTGWFLLERNKENQPSPEEAEKMEIFLNKLDKEFPSRETCRNTHLDIYRLITVLELELDSLIQKIIDKYEFGSKIEKYDN